MRIAIIATVPVWVLPGLEHLHRPGHYATWLESLIPEFARAQGLDLHWITMCKETKVPMEHRAFGQTFHILPRGKMSISMATGYIFEIRRIKKLLGRLNPDLLHAWGSEDVAGLAGALSGIQCRIFTLQGSLNEYLRLLGGSFLFRLQALYERPAVRRFTHGTAESPEARRLLLELNPAMVVKLVDYGVHPEFFETKWEPAPKPEMLFVGSISKRKGVADLIETARTPGLAHVKFKIAGAGALQEELEAQSPPNVEWLGKCSRAEVIQHMARSWALVMPTYADTGPTVVKEARVLGLPIITSTGAGASSYIESGKSGFVIKPGDLDALRDAVLSITVSRDTCMEMGRCGLEEIREQLHPRKTAENFAKLYRELLPE